MKPEELDDLKQFVTKALSKSEDTTLKHFVTTTVSQAEGHIIDDLKQFTEATISQSEARLKDDLASKEELRSLDDKVTGLEKKMMDGFSGVADAIDALDAHIDERFDKVAEGHDHHETRITKLEQNAISPSSVQRA